METNSKRKLGSTWYGAAWLVGQAGLAMPTGDDTGFIWPSDARLQIIIRPGEKLCNHEYGHIVRHQVDLTCAVEDQSQRHVAEQALEQVADLLSFSSGCPVRMYLEPFSPNPLPTAGSAYAARSFANLDVTGLSGSVCLHPPLLAAPDVVSAAHLPAMLNPTVRGRVFRTLRWQRRALLAREPIVAFAHGAFALEAVAPCLPQRDGNDTSARLRSFATKVVGLSNGVWKRVGSLRHKLFHGGIEETSDTIQDAAWCAHVAEYVLVAAVKHVLALGASAPPLLPRLSLGQLRDASMWSEHTIRPQPPARLW